MTNHINPEDIEEPTIINTSGLHPSLFEIEATLSQSHLQQSLHLGATGATGAIGSEGPVGRTRFTGNSW